MFGHIGTKSRLKALPERWESSTELKEDLAPPKRASGGVVPPWRAVPSLVPGLRLPSYIDIYIKSVKADREVGGMGGNETSL